MTPLMEPETEPHLPLLPEDVSLTQTRHLLPSPPLLPPALGEQPEPRPTAPARPTSQGAGLRAEQGPGPTLRLCPC